MKIRNEQLVALQQAEALNKKNTTTQGFDALLAGELKNGQAQGVTLAKATAVDALQQLASQVLSTPADATALEAVSHSTAGMQEAALQIDSLFSDMEKYADELGATQGVNLKSAYAMLESMSSRVAGLRSAYPGMEKTSPELASLVNDLDVLTTTEKFKMNRGDYL